MVSLDREARVGDLVGSCGDEIVDEKEVLGVVFNMYAKDQV